MRKQETGRLSSSATNIRSSNYSVPRCYGPSLSSYRYSASSYTPSVRASRDTHTESSYSTSTLPRSSYSSTNSGSSLTRSTSSSYARQPYQSPANTRSGAGSGSLSGYTPSRTSYSSATTASHAAPAPVQPSAPISTRSRSSSAISSYRSINVAHLNAQAKDRADRDEKDRNYSDWLEREKLREQELPSEPPIRDFRKKLGSTGSAPSQGYASFARSVVGRTEVSLPPPSEPPRYTPSYKPTATVQPLEDRSDRSEWAAPSVPSGFTGLRNIGNTCFMNATLQMLVNNIELKTYFLQKHYKLDVNPSNPLGFRGRLADDFAEFMRLMWSSQHRAIEPVKIKELVAEKASQFANFAQHDAHEFLSFLLDGLHEDVNRVKTKPITYPVEGDGRPDIEVASEAWRNHTLRNDSIFVDLYHGQLKSRLQCPNCDKVSITFDPFVYLPVPFPKAKKTTTVYFWPQDPQLKPIKISLQYNPEGTVHDMLTSLSDMVRVNAKNLRLLEIFSHRVQRVFQSSDKTSDICSGDVLYAFQIQDSSDCNEPVVELYVIQRQLYASALRYSCSDCGNSNAHLKACEACYNAYYCNKDCQLAHWNTGGHREECRRRSSAEAVGQPFMVSLPKSQLTYQHLMRIVEPKCRNSVDIFQMPQSGGTDSDPMTRSGSESSTKELKTTSGAPPTLYSILKKSPSPARTEKTERPERTERASSAKRQAVLPEQRKKTEHRMFLLRTLRDQAQITGETIPADKTGEPLDIASGTYISLNWYNLRNGKPYINVDSKKTLDVDEDKSARFAKLDGDKNGSGHGNPTLQQMLSMFSETERLKPEESWYCNQCKDHVEATKKLELYRLPPILIVQLKRFVYTATYQTMHRRSKDERRVIYPLNNLDMSPYLSETAPPEQCTEYDLTGVVCHSGSSYFGHYISMGKLPGFDPAHTEVDWRTFDDSIVSKQSSTSAQSDDAYLLFYKQKGTGTRHIFRKHYSCDPTEVPSIELNGCKENGI